MTEQPCLVTGPAAALDAINRRIRALLRAGELTAEGREEYGRLLVEWEAAIRAEPRYAA